MGKKWLNFVHDDWRILLVHFVIVSEYQSVKLGASMLNEFKHIGGVKNAYLLSIPGGQ